MSRWKRVLIVLGSVAAVFLAAVGGLFAWQWNGAGVSTVGQVRFDNELRVPPLAESTVEKDGTRVFSLRMQAGTTEFQQGLKTPTWGFNGSHLGPTLRAKRGEKVKVLVENTLDEASGVHWHGMHVPAKMDGGPHQEVAPGKTWTPQWKVDQPAATLWYHPHPHGKTEKHVQRGLAGMFLIDDARTASLKLPKRYGVDDLPVAVQDVAFDGADFDHGRRSFLQNTGFLGTRTMVNGTLDPYQVVGDELVRLRLLNASTARIYDFGFGDDRDFTLVGTDGGLLERPQTLKRVQLSPGERAEVVVRMRAGEKAVLRSFPQGNYGGGFEQRFAGGDDSFDVLELRAAAALRKSPKLPSVMGALEVPQEKDAARGRFFGLRMSGINGRKMDRGHVDETVVRGTAEVWTVRNEDGAPHNFHVHDVRFRVVLVDGKPPTGMLRGAKDTVYVPGGSTVKLAMRFEGPADPDTPYMYHCHLLYHEDQGMMGQFVVVEKGQKEGTPASGGHGGH
ncbi:multicopper oxidase domain-containing protein [Streptomyces sp. NBC_00237]|uniref:multicopper oxidase family protein n=1 Tax=Streptomyces sp. NBC_00237 TaxID=2975687 RepID=UPI0022528AA9|nr:multicopper oxidase domain-containing protein [Streptomyces sp. NBC_00237]MCX5204767.1 multicopper oxidase domain-containing protein [Streptomyces sp. NBC_00237]